MPTILGANTLSTGYDVANSLTLDDDSSAFLSKTFSGDGTHHDKGTVSVWLKRAELGAEQGIFTAGSSNRHFIRFESGGNLTFRATTDSFHVQTTQVFRDPSAWYHIVIAYDTSQGTASNRVKMYVNGSQVSSFSQTDYPDQDLDIKLGAAELNCIGKDSEQTNPYFDGYMCEFAYIDGTQLAASSFGEFDEDSPAIWKPKKFVNDVTFGTNGFYMEFKQTGTSANSSGMGADTSGNDNHFSASGTATTDITTDTPTNNFCVMNPLIKSSLGSTNQPTYSEGNVRVDNHGSGDASTLSTFGVANGKWYFEAKYSKSPSDAQGYPQLGWAKNGNHNDGEMVGFHTPSGSDYRAKNGSSVISNAFDGVPAANDIIGFYLDLDNSTLIVHQNGSDFMGSGASSGIDFSSTNFDPDTGFFQVRYNSNTNIAHFIEFNFGQPSYSISSAVSDANGHGSFEYNPTLSGTDYLALCTKNLGATG